MRTSNHRLGLALVTASAVAWSTAGFFARLIHLDSMTMLAWRGVFGALGISAVSAILRGWGAWHDLRAMGRPGWLFAAVSSLGMIFFIASLGHTTVAHVAVIYATVPLFAVALGWVMIREAPSGSAVLASLASVIGVVLMVGFGVEGGLSGDLLGLGMTLSMAAMIAIARRFRDIPIMPAAGLSALLSGLVCWPFGHPLDVGSHDLLLLAMFGLVNSAAGLALFTLGAGLLPAVETALIGALDAPLAPLWVWLAFQETPSAATVIGGSVVFAAVGTYMVAEFAKRAA